MVLFKLLYDCFPILLGFGFNKYTLLFSQVYIPSEFFFERVQHRICVRLMTSSENDNLIELFGLLEAIVNVWTHVYACIDSFTLLELHRYWQVVWQIVNIVHTVDQGLIQIEYKCFLKRWRWQHHWLLSNYFRVGWWSHLHIVKWLHCLNQVILMQITLWLLLLLWVIRLLSLLLGYILLFWISLSRRTIISMIFDSFRYFIVIESWRRLLWLVVLRGC